MRYFKGIDILIKASGSYKPAILGLLVLASTAIALHFNFLLGVNNIYTHLFYIPIIMAGVWYHRKAVYVALFFGLVHILISYVAHDGLLYDAPVRAAIFICTAYIVGSIAEKKDSLYDALKHSDEKLRQAYDSLEQRIKERTAVLSSINEALRNEISERQHAEKALRESEENFWILTEYSPVSILLYRGDRIIYVNRTTELTTGYTREELLSGQFFKFVHPDSRAMVIERTRARLRGEQVPKNYELEIVNGEGETRWLDVSADLIVYGGVPTGLVSGIDITDRKKAEKELIKSRAILSRAQSIAHVGTWAWNIKDNDMQWSDEIYRLFGYEPEHFRPDYPWLMDHVHPDDRKLVADAMDAAISENKLFNIDFRIMVADGSIKYVNCVADKLRRDREGRPLWMYGIAQDITARKRAEEELKAAKSQAELYLDLMGHDINNMNQIVIGFLEMALDMLKLADEERQMISRPLEALESSSQLISNVRKLQRARDGGLALHEMDIGETLNKLIPQYSRVAGRNITINYRADGEYRVLANDLLSDVFSNIIGNAVKHSSGDLAIDISLKKALVNGKRHCIVCIEDNGPGIPDEIKGRLFSEQHRHKAITGSGLGLYLVKTLVDDFHGTVDIEDRVAGDHSKGCRFTIAIPEMLNQPYVKGQS